MMRMEPVQVMTTKCMNCSHHKNLIITLMKKAKTMMLYSSPVTVASSSESNCSNSAKSSSSNVVSSYAFVTYALHRSSTIGNSSRRIFLLKLMDIKHIRNKVNHFYDLKYAIITQIFTKYLTVK